MSDENAAALKVQNLQRKKEARKAVDARRALKAEQDAADEEVKRAEASRRLGAGARGYKQRREAQKQRVAESSAATKMQATFRGKAERDGGDAAARRARLKADPEAAAAEYARKHGLHDLFGMLGQQLVAEKPEDRCDRVSEDGIRVQRRIRICLHVAEHGQFESGACID